MFVEEGKQIVPDQTAHKSSLIWNYFVCTGFLCLSSLVPALIGLELCLQNVASFQQKQKYTH